jgi:hypothetical protein
VALTPKASTGLRTSITWRHRRDSVISGVSAIFYTIITARGLGPAPGAHRVRVRDYVEVGGLMAYAHYVELFQCAWYVDRY